MEIRLAMPGTYYKGTRFDWTGIFRSIEKGGLSYADQWFDTEDPLRHDNVCGPSEEFSPVWIDSTHCVKVGVGILEVPEGVDAYDRFKLYKIVIPGIFDITASEQELRCRHLLEGYYEYEKVVTIIDGSHFRIAHSMRWLESQGAEMTCYNHNFFTMGCREVGPDRRLVFDGPVMGQWREDSVSGCKDGSSLCFARLMQPGEKCFIGNLTVGGCESEPYHFVIEERSCSVDVHCDKPMLPSVFWSNHRVSCVEPYVDVELISRRESRWNIDYELK